MYRIEALLSARLFLRPERVGDRIFFLSNLSGHNSLYAMDYGGSVPEPLLPPNIVLQNPHLIGGDSFAVLDKLGQIIVMIDRDGDENYLPMMVPVTGGFPEPAFNNFFENTRCHLGNVDPDLNLCLIMAESREEGMIRTYLCNFATSEVEELAASPYGYYPSAVNEDYSRMVLVEGYMVGDTVAYLWEKGNGMKLLYGKPITEREPGEEVPLAAFGGGAFVEGGKGLIFTNAIFQDTYGLGYMNLDHPEDVVEVPFEGLAHSGAGEYEGMEPLKNGCYLLHFNIDGASWVYEAEYDPKTRRMHAVNILAGKGVLSDGVLEAINYDQETNSFAVAFSTATSPTQIYTIEGKDRDRLVRHTNESILGIPKELLSPGEDLSFVSYDGLRASAQTLSAVTGTRFQRSPSCDLLRSRRSTGPGTAGFLLVLHAPDRISYPTGICSFCPQRTGQHGVWFELYQICGS